MQQPNSAPEGTLDVRAEWRNGVDRLVVAGVLDVFTAPVLQREVDTVVHVGGALVLDLRDLASIDRFGLHSLKRIAEYASRDGWRLSIVNCRAADRHLFERAGMDHLLGVTDAFDALDPGDESRPIPLPSLLGQRRTGPHQSGRSGPAGGA